MGVKTRVKTRIKTLAVARYAQFARFPLLSMVKKNARKRLCRAIRATKKGPGLV